MRKSRPVAALVLVAVLAGCGGAAARTYTRQQAYRIVTNCLRTVGGKVTGEASGNSVTASVEGGGNLQWGYVLSAGKVADVFFTQVTPVGPHVRAKLNACLKPHGWSVG